MKTVIILSTMRAPEEVIKDTVNTLLRNVPDATLIISMNDASGVSYWNKAAECTASWGSRVYILVTTSNNSYLGNDRISVVHTEWGNRSALIYLNGYDRAVTFFNAEWIVEMDLGGSMNPNEVNGFIEGLQNYKAVLSTRRVKDGGNMINTPIQRRLLSFIGTLLSKTCLGLRQALDMTSGYEAFNANIIRDLFTVVPPHKWLCVTHNAAHLFQTEMRSYVLWSTDSVKWVPITFGANKHGKPITDYGYLLRNFLGFLRLIGRRFLFRN